MKHNDLCPVCHGPLLALFREYVCKRECDLPESEKSEEYKAPAVYKKAWDNFYNFQYGYQKP